MQSSRVKVCKAYEANKHQVTLLPPRVRESSGSEISGLVGQRKCNSFNLLASKVCHLVGFDLVLEPSGSTRGPWLEVAQTSLQGGGVGMGVGGGVGTISTVETVKREKHSFSVFFLPSLL